MFETLQTEMDNSTICANRSAQPCSSTLPSVGRRRCSSSASLSPSTNVLDSFAQLSAVSGGANIAFDPTAIKPAREQHRFYVVTQATMLACGWFAGAASAVCTKRCSTRRALVLVAYVVFAGAGLI